jgi:hypothetical protein
MRDVEGNYSPGVVTSPARVPVLPESGRGSTIDGT